MPARAKDIHTLFGPIDRVPELFLPSGHAHRTVSARSGAGIGPQLFSGPGAFGRTGRGQRRLRVGQRGSAGPGRRELGGTPNPAVGQPGRSGAGHPVGRGLPTSETDPIPILYAEVDGTGVPMVAEELAGRPGKQEDGSAKTREVKLGAIFTQTKTDEEGLPVRDHASTTYVGSFESAPDFGSRIRAEGLRRGLGRAAKVVFIGDGAAWIWELARVNFPAAILILDLYHALERLHTLCAGLYGAGQPLGGSGWRTPGRRCSRTTRLAK